MNATARKTERAIQIPGSIKVNLETAWLINHKESEIFVKSQAGRLLTDVEVKKAHETNPRLFDSFEGRGFWSIRVTGGLSPAICYVEIYKGQLHMDPLPSSSDRYASLVVWTVDETKGLKVVHPTYSANYQSTREFVKARGGRLLTEQEASDAVKADRELARWLTAFWTVDNNGHPICLYVKNAGGILGDGPFSVEHVPTKSRPTSFNAEFIVYTTEDNVALKDTTPKQATTKALRN